MARAGRTKAVEQSPGNFSQQWRQPIRPESKHSLSYTSDFMSEWLGLVTVSVRGD